MSNLNKIHKKITKIFSIVAIIILALSNTVAYAEKSQNLKSGIYEMNNDVYHDSEVGISMARSYTADVMELEYTKDKIAYTVTFTGTDYMENYRILVNDKPVDFKIVEEDKENTSIKLNFEVADINDKITAQIFVSAMDRDVEFEVRPLVETLNLVEEIEDVKEEVLADESKESNTKDSTEEKSSEKSPIIPIVIGAVVIIIAVVVFMGMKKK